jgi:hypothetical protein
MKILSMEQCSPEWFEARRGLPTASSFKRFITAQKGDLSMNRKKTGLSEAALAYACELAAELGTSDSLVPDRFVSPAMSAGIAMEPEIRNWYAFERGVDVGQVGLIVTDDGRIGASPDGVVGADGLLECKHPEAATHIRWMLDGVLPAEHKAQVHGQLAVSGRKWVDFLSYHPPFEPFMVRVVRTAYTVAVEVALAAFLAEYDKILAKVFPGREFQWLDVLNAERGPQMSTGKDAVTGQPDHPFQILEKSEFVSSDLLRES